MQEPPSEFEKVDRLRRAIYSRSLSPKFKGRPRRPLESDQESVGEDWQRPEPEFSGSIIAPRDLKTGKGPLWWLFMIAAAFCVGALGFLAYYFTIGGGAVPASPGNIDISVTGPLHIAGGDVAELQIGVSNKNRAALQLADLVITYPPGTRLPSDLSTDVPSQRIALGTIGAGSVRQVPIRAMFAGAEGQHASVKIELEYRLQGSSAVFVASSNYDIVFSSSPLSIAIDGNSQTVSGQPVTLTMTITSNAPAPVKDVLLSVGYPFGFTFSSSDPNPARAGVWELGDLSPGRSITVTVRGTLVGESGDERVFHATIGTRKAPQNQNIDTPLADSSFRTAISQPFLGIGVSVNQENGTSVIVRPGDNVDVIVSWQNNLSVPITDAVIVARLGGLIVDGQSVRAEGGFYRSSDSAVLWDKTTSGGLLSNLPPGAQGQVKFSFKVPLGDVLQTIQNPHLTITVNAAGKRLSEAGVPESLQATATQNIKLASNVQLAAQGLYYANPFGSVGPMPPKAGSETTYAVAFSVTNTTNAIKNAKLTATLPPYVRWLGMYLPASSENVKFNASDGTVLWNIGDIAAGAGLGGVPARQMAFAIGFTPSTSQIGDAPILVQGIALSGTDASTGDSIAQSVADVTTNIVGDRGFSSSNAIVVR